MGYKILFSTKADKQFEKLDAYTKKQIWRYIDKNLNGSLNPKLHGKALVGDLKNLWRYRIGDYRLVCRIEDGVCEILVVKVGHRKDIYE